PPRPGGTVRHGRPRVRPQRRRGRRPHRPGRAGEGRQRLRLVPGSQLIRPSPHGEEPSGMAHPPATPEPPTPPAPDNPAAGWLVRTSVSNPYLVVVACLLTGVLGGI